MPLKAGSSQKTFSGNVRDRKKGKIGKTTPKSAEHARRIALAAAFSKKQEGMK